MRRLFLWLLPALCLLSTRLYGGELLAYRDSLKNAYDFLLYVPDSYDERPDDSFPVVVCLHGKSLAGRDLNLVTRYGCVDALRRGTRIDAVVICPQCPSSNGWNAAKVMDVVDFVYARYRCDADRLYVYGMSMGGWGVYKMVAEYPERIAAAISLCGGYTGDAFESMGRVPLWIIHGMSDEATSLTYSTNLVQQLTDAGAADRVRFTFLADQGHSILARVFLLNDTYKWLFKHKLSTPGRPCSREYEVTVTDLRRAYIYLENETRRQLPVSKP